MFQHKTSFGFTFIEILIVLVIITAISSIIAASLLSYTAHQALLGTTGIIIGELQDARSRTLSSQGGFQYGVHFQNDQTVLFKGATYNSADSTNEVTAFDSRMQIETISLSGGSVDVVFDRLTGETASPGTVKVSVRSDPTVYKTITIQKTGLISYN